jgi:putative ABC transport system permease protein
VKLTEILATAWENMKQRKLRSSLTTLSVVIGITAIISLASLGEGFRFDVKQRMEQGFELDVLIIFPGSFMAGLGQGFNQTDVNAIQTVNNVTLVTPLTTMPTAELHNMNNTKLGAFTLGGINFTEMQEMFPERFHLMQGHFPTAEENKSIVLGYKAGILNDTVLANVGDNITLTLVNKYGVYNETFEVDGILEKGGTSGITNFDYWAFIPIETALQIPGVEGYQILLAKVSDTKYSEQVAKEIESKFKQYSITVFVPSSLMRQVDNILNIVQLFLMAIASISLLVAGVGIMNIMTVAVMERTREIGILKAIGAKSRTVLGMFLAEAALIGIMGGLIGVFVGYGLSYGLANVLSNFIQPSRQNAGVVHVPETERMTITPVFSLEWTIVAFIFAIIVCIIFGLYPARKAAKLNPVEALRYE